MYINQLLYSVCLVLLFAISANSKAFGSDGNELLVHCKAVITGIEDSKSRDTELALKATACIGIVRGMLVASIFYESNSNSNILCFPDKLTTKQAIRIVVKFLEDNPKKLHESDHSLIMESLYNAYSCEKK